MFAASEAGAAGYRGVAAVSRATGIASSSRVHPGLLQDALLASAARNASSAVMLCRRPLAMMVAAASRPWCPIQRGIWQVTLRKNEPRGAQDASAGVVGAGHVLPPHEAQQQPARNRSSCRSILAWCCASVPPVKLSRRLPLACVVHVIPESTGPLPCEAAILPFRGGAVIPPVLPPSEAVPISTWPAESCVHSFRGYRRLSLAF